MNITSIIKPLTIKDPFQQINFNKLPIEESFLAYCEKFFGIRQDALNSEFTYEDTTYKIVGHSKGCNTALILEVNGQEGVAVASVTSVLFMLYRAAPDLLMSKMPNNILKYASLGNDYLEATLSANNHFIELLRDFFGKDIVPEDAIAEDINLQELDLSKIPYINTTFTNYLFK